MTTGLPERDLPSAAPLHLTTEMHPQYSLPMSASINVESIEATLAARQISVSRLLYRAEVAGSTWHRLKRGHTKTVHRSTARNIQAALEALLREHDEAVRDQQAGVPA